MLPLNPRLARLALGFAALLILMVPGGFAPAGRAGLNLPQNLPRIKGPQNQGQAVDPKQGNQGGAYGTKAIIPADRAGQALAIISIKGPIDGSRFGSVMASSVRRRIQAAVAAGADTLVFELDTPGGSVPATLDICQAIQQSQVENTVAWINPNALSGGAIIALCCKHIVVNTSAMMGDAMPIMIGPGGKAETLNDAELRKKVLPPLILQTLTSAREHNRDAGRYVRDEYLLMAIVANDVELWWVRNKETGVEMAIDRAEFEVLFPGVDPASPTRLAPIPGGTKPSDATVVVQPGEGAPAGSSKLAGVVPSLVDTNQLSSSSSRPEIKPADAGKWELLTKVSDGSAPAILSADDLAFFGMLSNDRAKDPTTGTDQIVPIKSETDLQNWAGAAKVTRYDANWVDGLVIFLTNTIVRGILIAIFLLAIFAEMTHPGAAVPALVAVGALVLLVAPTMVVGLTNWWEVSAIIGGVLLIALEILVIPGFGVAGVLGIPLLFGGLVATFVPAGGTLTQPGETRDRVVIGLLTVLAASFSAGVGMYFLVRNMGSIPLVGKLILKDPGTGDDDEGFFDVIAEEQVVAKVGQHGVAQTDLRPSGRIMIGDRLVDAVAEIGYIKAGANVVVVSVSGLRVGVEVAKSEA
jgi:membrane-bound ClpP family serine protease